MSVQYPEGGFRLEVVPGPRRTHDLTLRIELDREDDGRSIAEVLEMPGVIVYGASPEAAVWGAEALALHVLADRLEAGEVVHQRGDPFSVLFVVLDEAAA